MATLKFRTYSNGGLEQTAIKEVVRKYEGTYEVKSIVPSKIHPSDVIVTLEFPGDTLPALIERTAKGMEFHRAIHLISK